MKRTPIDPRLSEPNLPADLEPVDVLARRDELLQCRLAGLTGDVDALGAHLTECELVRPDLGRLDLTAATLIDCQLSDIRATTLTARDATVRRVRIDGGRIATLDLGNARIESLELRDLHIGYLNLADAQIEDSVLRECRIDTLDLPLATVKRALLEHCSVTELDTRGLNAEHLDLRSSELSTVTDIAGLRGSHLTAAQLMMFHVKLAQHLGIILD